jgi:hypothetical protein
MLRAINKYCILLWATLFITPCGYSAQDMEEIEERLNSVEQRQKEIERRTTEGPGLVRPFLRDSIYLGGFFEHATLGIWGPDTKTQVSATLNILGLNITAELTNNLRFSTQLVSGLTFPLQNIDNDPRGATLGLPESRRFSSPTFGAVVPQGYVEYQSDEKVNLQGGVGYAPFGIALQQKEWTLFKRRGGPQFIAPAAGERGGPPQLLLSTAGGSAVTIANANWSGVHFYGYQYLNGGRFGYNAYTLTPVSNPRTLGAGARLWWQPSETLTLGLSSQLGKRSGDTYKALGTDIKIILEDFGIDAELARNISESKDPWTFYLEPHLTFFHGAFIVYIAIDYLENTLNSTVAPIGSGGGIRGPLEDPNQEWVWGGGVNWLPTPLVRVRLGFFAHDYTGDTALISQQERDYYNIDASIGVAF